MTTTLPQLDHALSYASIGWHIFPVHAIGKFGYCDCGKKNCKDAAKHPRTYRGVFDATSDIDQVKKWWSAHPGAGIGMHPGPSGVVAIDLDKYKDEYDASATGQIITAQDENTITSLTGGGGVHLIYKLPDGAKFGSSNNGLPAGIDVRCYGGYIILPESSHKSGGTYQWEIGYGPSDIALLPLPQKLHDILRAAQRTAATTRTPIAPNLPPPDLRPWNLPGWLVSDLDIGHMAQDRSTNDFRVICALGERGLSDDDISAIWQHCPIGTDGKYADPKQGDKYLSTSISAMRAKVGHPAGQYNGYQNGSKATGRSGALPGNPSGMAGNQSSATGGKATSTPPPATPSSTDYLLTLPTDDQGVADCVLMRYAGRFLHTKSHGWLHYNGTHWTNEGAEEKLGSAVTETLQARIGAAIAAGFQNHIEIIRRSARNNRQVKSAIAQMQFTCTIPIADFDSDPDLLNCKNGVVDLRTGAITPHDSGQRFMYALPISYNPTADYVEQHEWLAAATDPDTADYMKMAVGYSLTGHIREEVLFYVYGPPRSGKGTFFDSMLEMMGSPLAQAVSFATFTAKRDGDSQNFDLAPLKAARFIAASESNTYERFNEALLKTITGGDKISCAFKHRDHFDYRPKYKIWLASNNPINADPDDDAAWGRIRTINFHTSHLGCEDKGLKQRMVSPEALEAWLAWSVAGSIDWYALGSSGLPELASMAKLKKQQRDELDHVQQWIDDACDRSDPIGFAPVDLVRPSYENWCKSNGVAPKAAKGLTQALAKKGHPSGRQTYNYPIAGTKQARGYVGLRVK